jgi:hypothetical protein
MRKIIVFLIFSSILLVDIASADMDWANMEFKVSSTNQLTAALIREELYSVQYDASKTVGEFLRMNFDREQRLNSLLLESQNVKQRYLTNGSIQYTCQLPVTGKILTLLLPEQKPVKLVVPMLCPYCEQEWPRSKPVPTGLELIPKQVEYSDYTGIIIDCRNFKLNPCLFPRIYNDMSEEVFSINFADLYSTVEGGLVLYTTHDLYNNPRIGYNPLRIQAMGLMGDKMTDIKISSFDARRIHGSKKNLQLLKECRVVIIYSP